MTANLLTAELCHSSSRCCSFSNITFFSVAGSNFNPIHDKFPISEHVTDSSKNLQNAELSSTNRLSEYPTTDKDVETGNKFFDFSLKA